MTIVVLMNIDHFAESVIEIDINLRFEIQLEIKPKTFWTLVIRTEPLKVAKFSHAVFQFSPSPFLIKWEAVGIWLRPPGNAAYVACLWLLYQGSKLLSSKSVWLVFTSSSQNQWWQSIPLLVCCDSYYTLQERCPIGDGTEGTVGLMPPRTHLWVASVPNKFTVAGASFRFLW